MGREPCDPRAEIKASAIIGIRYYRRHQHHHRLHSNRSTRFCPKNKKRPKMKSQLHQGLVINDGTVVSQKIAGSRLDQVGLRPHTWIRSVLLSPILVEFRCK